VARLLLIEDENRLRDTLRRGLVEEGHDVSTAGDGTQGLKLATAGGWDAAVLDLMLPGMSGLEILRAMRAGGDRTPVLLLTARRAVGDRVEGLDAGADDYLVKPFAFEELLARIRALLRRVPAESVLSADGLRLDLIRRRVLRDGRELELTAREFALLEHLLRRRGETVGRDEIAREVWHDPSATMTNIIDVYVNYLRGKLETPGRPRRIHTVRGRGYCWRDEP